MKAQGDEGGGRLLLGDNTSGQAVMLQPILFHCVGVCTSNRLPRLKVMQLVVWVFSCELCNIRLVVDLPERDHSVSRVCVCVYVRTYLFIYVRYVTITAVCTYLGSCVLVSEAL